MNLQVPIPSRVNEVCNMDIWSILYPQSFNIDIPEESCIDNIIIFDSNIFHVRAGNIHFVLTFGEKAKELRSNSELKVVDMDCC